MNILDRLENWLSQGGSETTSQPSKKPTLRDQWWPAIPDQPTARKVARRGFWAAVVVAAVTSVFAGLAAFGRPLGGISANSFVEAAVFAVIAIGIWRMSRTAAVAGLTLFGLEKLLAFQHAVRPPGIFLAIAVLVGFVHAVRATFAYHKLGVRSPTVTEPFPVEPR